jgi:hypothetical protein
MREKPYMEIKSIAPELAEEAVKQHGRPPDNFVESGEATIVGLPDLDSDPEGRGVVEALDKAIASITKANRLSRNGADETDGTDAAGPTAD